MGGVFQRWWKGNETKSDETCHFVFGDPNLIEELSKAPIRSCEINEKDPHTRVTHLADCEEVTVTYEHLYDQGFLLRNYHSAKRAEEVKDYEPDCSDELGKALSRD